MFVERNIAFIENRILCNAIWGDTSCINPIPRFTGYVQANVDKVGKAFIEYCIAKVYGVFRLPQCGYDNYLGGYSSYDVLATEEVADACREMEQVITHVQKMLSSDIRVVDGCVSVVRCLAKYQVAEAVKQLECDNIKKIDIPVSIISSYSYDGNNSQRYPTGDFDKLHVNIRENVPIEDIVLWDCYVGNGHQSCTRMKSMLDIECELWVVDRSINGRRKIDRNCFYYTDGLPNVGTAFDRDRFWGYDKPVCDRTHIKRPCEDDDFLTRYVMRRNSNKIYRMR